MKVPLASAMLAFVLFAVPLAGEAQQAGKVWRIGVLSFTRFPGDASRHSGKGFEISGTSKAATLSSSTGTPMGRTSCFRRSPLNSYDRK